jgi:hypothetical protein
MTQHSDNTRSPGRQGDGVPAGYVRIPWDSVVPGMEVFFWGWARTRTRGLRLLPTARTRSTRSGGFGSLASPVEDETERRTLPVQASELPSEKRAHPRGSSTCR